VVKVQEKEKKEQTWVEEDQKAQKEEWSKVVALDEEVAEKALEMVAKEMWVNFCQVSSRFFFGLYLGIDCSSAVGLGGIGKEARTTAGTLY